MTNILNKSSHDCTVLLCYQGAIRTVFEELGVCKGAIELDRQNAKCQTPSLSTLGI